MKNLIKLQRQYALIIRVFLAIGDLCILFLAVLLSSVGGWREAFSGIETGIVLVLAVLVVFHFFLLLTHTLSAEMKGLPEPVLAAMDRECMTGLQWGNAILCKSGYLLIVCNRLTAVLPENMVKVEKKKFGRGYLIWLTDRWGEVYRLTSPATSAKGNGTFRQADTETFYKELKQVISRNDSEDWRQKENSNAFQPDIKKN